MKWSQLYVPMLKEVPKEATIQSHILMLRSGLIIKQGSGVYGYLPLGLKILDKIENIIQEEIEAIGGQKIYLPHLVPQEIWAKTGRFKKMGKLIFSLQDRHNNDFLLGPTYEESIVDMLQGFVKSYKQLPMNFFQIAKKFRDEIRPRYGVMRGREFIMMDGYSLHTSTESLEQVYQLYKKAYRRLFARMGLETVPVSADSGDMGGEGSEEFMVPSHIGDDTIFLCQNCQYVANQEKALSIPQPRKKFEFTKTGEIHTPSIKTIADLSQFTGVPEDYTAKTIVYKTQNQQWVIAIVRGDREINEVKLQNLLGGDILLETPASEVEKYIGPVGFLGPYNLCKKDNWIIILDKLLEDQEYFLVGMNQQDYHYQKFSFKGFTADIVADIISSRVGDICSHCQSGILESFSGIEVGHIFKLGNDYSQKMGFQVLDSNGKTLSPLMGCYGIGVDRSFAAVIEQNHDEAGIILPLSIAPFTVLITPIGKDNLPIGETLYKELNPYYDILLDDRDISAGIKFKEADLMGIPIRITIGKRFKEEGLIGFKVRREIEETFIKKDQLVKYITQYIQAEKNKERELLENIDKL